MLSHSQTPFLASPFPWTVFSFVPLRVLSVWILLWWWLSGNFATSFYTTLRFPKLLLVYWLCMLNRMLLGFLIMIESFLRMFEKGTHFDFFLCNFLVSLLALPCRYLRFESVWRQKEQPKYFEKKSHFQNGGGAIFENALPPFPFL